MKKCLVVGICGGTGSGKTTLARRLVKALGEDALLIGMDNYYRDRPDLTLDERRLINYDMPDAFDIPLLSEHLNKLKNGESADLPTYDFAGYRRLGETIHTGVRKIVIIEGILLFSCPEIADRLDYRIYVDADADVRILRRILRDVKERGRTLDSVVTQYLTTVKPVHDSVIEPSKRLADIIVPDGGQNDAAFEMILSTVKRFTEEN